MPVILVDNGSVEPASTLQLRRLAAALAVRLGERVIPASLAHSSRVAAEALGGESARLFEHALDQLVDRGETDVVVAPLFVGPSYAVTRQIPAMLRERKARRPNLTLALAEPLFAAGEGRLTAIMADHIREQLPDLTVRPRVVVVDHGSPTAAVTHVRDVVSAQVAQRLGPAVAAVSPASMERRDGAAFDFNEPQLERLLAQPGWRDEPLVIGLLFVAPGRHAGPGGDVAQMVKRARSGAAAPVRFSRLLGEHPLLVDILADRITTARPKVPADAG